MTLNDLERRNSPNDCVITSNSVALWADYIKVVEDTPKLSAAGRPKNPVFSDIMAISAGDHPSESVKVKHYFLVSEKMDHNLETVQDRR